MLDKLTEWLIPLTRYSTSFFSDRYVIVHGFYGAGNVGDESILEATLNSLDRVSDLETLVFAWDPEQVKSDFGVEALNPQQSPIAALWAIMRSRCFLLGGGGLIKDYGEGSESLLRWLRWINVARRLGIRTMTWAIGVGNVIHAESERCVRKVLAEIDEVTVRDSSSKLRLEEMGLEREVRVTADPVVGWARKRWRADENRRRDDKALKIAVCPRFWFATSNRVEDKEVFDDLLYTFSSTLDYLQSTYNAQIVFIPFRTKEQDDDRRICEEIRGRMKSKEGLLLDNLNPSPSQTLARLTKVDIQIGMRLHSSIMATSVGVPSVAVAYLPKVIDYMKSIREERFCVDIRKASPEWMIEAVEEIIATYDARRTSLFEHTSVVADRCRESEEMLSRLLGARTAM